MEKNLDKSAISTPSELAELTARFIDQFCSLMAFPSNVDIRVDRHPKSNDQRSPHVSPVRASLKKQKLTVHLCDEALLGIPPLALQGWLDMELARRQLELEPATYRVNFDKEIRPLFYTGGSGLHLVRHMVVHLEASLKNLIAAQFVIAIGNSKPLLYYYTYKISPSVEEKENYERLFPHHWIRAIFLCNKNRGFTPVALLADTGIAAELESYWWDCHAYIAPEDKRFLKTIFRLSNQNPVKHFSEALVEMFKFVKSQLLIP
jgi:hypothetical protein